MSHYTGKASSGKGQTKCGEATTITRIHCLCQVYSAFSPERLATMAIKVKRLVNYVCEEVVSRSVALHIELY